MSESPFAPPTVDEQPPAFSPTPKTEIPLGPRIAGMVLVIGALISLLASTSEGAAPGGIISALIDIAIGGSLIVGRAQFLVWAKLRVVLGLLFYGAMSIHGGDYYSVIFQTIFSLALMGLLLGTPSAARIGVSATTSGLCLVFVAIGILGGSLPIFSPYLGQLDDVPGGRIVRDDYQISVPADWKLRKREAAAKDNPAAEVWLVHAPSDSHVLVIPERLGTDMVVDLSAFEQNVLDHLGDVVSELEVKRTIPSHGGLLIESHGKVEGLALDYIHRLYVSGGFGAQVVAFGPEGKLASDTREIVDSFVYGAP